MNRNRQIAAAAALLCTCAATPALAQETFQGPYVSVYGGLSMVGDGPTDVLFFDTDGDGDFDDTVRTTTGANAFSPGFCTGAALSATGPCTSDPQEEEYGVRVGLDGRPGGGMFLAGVMVEVGKSDMSNSTSGFSTTPASYIITRRMDYAVSARGRVGAVLGDRLLAYGTGGVSYAKIDQIFYTTNTANSFTEVNDDKMRLGYQVGGGLEAAITPNFTFGLEYLRSVYDDDGYYVEVGPGTAPATNPFLLGNPAGTDLRASNDKLRMHSLRLTGSFRF